MLRRAFCTAMEQPKPVYAAIQKKISDALKPKHFDVIDESSQHAGHIGNPSGDPSAETHFRLHIVSTEFEGKSLVQRHRMVYSLLDEELKGGVHALALKAKTPTEEGM